MVGGQEDDGPVDRLPVAQPFSDHPGLLTVVNKPFDLVRLVWEYRTQVVVRGAFYKFPDHFYPSLYYG